jgi:hypothetical protein
MKITSQKTKLNDQSVIFLQRKKDNEKVCNLVDDGMFQFLVALRGIHCVGEFCTLFNSKTCKYSQPSFKMKLLCNCVLTN